MARNSDSQGIVVLGLGRFGSAVALSLQQLGHDVLAIDENAALVQEWSGQLTHVVQANTTNIETLRQLSCQNFQHAIVAIGSDLEASVLTVMALSELGVPDIWAKAVTKRHARILERTGAHHVVFPEAAMGERVAHLVTGKMMDFIQFDDGFAIAKTRAPRDYAGKALGETSVRRHLGVTVIGVKRVNQDFLYARPDTVMEAGDVLIVCGPTDKVEAFAALA